MLSLSSQSLWWDEAFTWQTTSHGWDNLWRLLQTGDRNPPLYFVLTTAWGSVAGWSEFSLRFVSLACGLIGAAFLFALARRLFGLRAGVWTLGLAAVAPALVAYSQEARMYALFFALAAATLYFAGRVFGIGNQQCECHSERSAGISGPTNYAACRARDSSSASFDSATLRSRMLLGMTRRG